MLRKQLVTPSTTESFELTTMLHLNGYKNIKDYHFVHVRQWLTDHGYVKERIHGREEYWKYAPDKILSPEIYTLESYCAKFFPGITQQTVKDQAWQFKKILRSRGLRPRMGGLYWSPKLERRRSVRQMLPKVASPKYVRIPRGAFTLLDMLELNKMRRYPENFAWCKKVLAEKNIQKLPDSWRYAAKDRRGKLPAAVTQNWELPGDAFTTHQFQQLNNALQPSKAEWRAALRFLETNGYAFNPRWRRWIKR